jgi:nucleotide-binding universal stress UspA family protein
MSTYLAPGAVVVGVDGSPASEVALRWAAEEAHRHGRGLFLVHALAWPTYAAASGLPPAAWADDDLRHNAEAILRRAAEQAHGIAPDVPVHAEVRRGTPAAVLTAASERAPMVVLGTRGSGGFHGLVVGSVSTQVARHAAGVVVVVPEQSHDRHRRVVVGTDGSPGAEAAVRFAFDEAATHRATLVVVRAWQPPLALRHEEFGGGDGQRPEFEAAEEQLLVDSVRAWADKYPQVTVEHRLVADHAARALTGVAEDALLLVVGSRGHGGFRGLHLGSVSMQVLHHASGPVAIVRHARQEPDDQPV